MDCSHPGYCPEAVATEMAIRMVKNVERYVIVCNSINEKIIALKTQLEENKKPKSDNPDSDSKNQNNNRGTVIMDATACPQDIAYPTDLNLLNDSREKSEYLIDILYDKEFQTKKKSKKTASKPLGA